MKQTKKIKWFSTSVIWTSKENFVFTTIIPYPACKIYKRICCYESTYVGETKRNVEVRYLEYNHPSGKSEPSKHLNHNINHVYLVRYLLCTKNWWNTKALEAFYIAIMRPNLNEQCNSNVWTLFRKGIT